MRILDLYCCQGGCGMRQAIPPAYTEFIGRQLMAHLLREAA